MARILGEELMSKLRKDGIWGNIMKEINKDPDLSPEIREGALKIYYQKGLILTLEGKKVKPVPLADGYYKGDILTEIDPLKPQKYFQWAKEKVGNYNKSKREFVIQQRIAKDNSSKESRFLVVDMEYQFSQGNIPRKDRVDVSRIDIVAIEKSTNDIVLFELKQGAGALKGKSGVEDHIRKTNILINDSVFCEKLRKDITQIITQKNELGILKCGNEIPLKFNKIKMGIIFISYSNEDQKEFDTIMKKGYGILTICKDFSCTIL